MSVCCVVGTESVGHLWPTDTGAGEGDDSDSEDELDVRNHTLTRLGAQLDSLHLNNRAASSHSSLSSLSRASSSTSLASATSSSFQLNSSLDPPSIANISSLQDSTPQSDFLSECLQSLERSFNENHTVDNAVIELKTLRMASNVPLEKVREVVVPFLLNKGVTSSGSDVGKTIERWGGILANLTGEEQSSMKHCLKLSQKWCSEQSGPGGELRFFLKVLKGFYEEDVVNEDAVFEWYKSEEARNSIGGEKGKELWKGSKVFIEALMQDDDSDEEEESD